MVTNKDVRPPVHFMLNEIEIMQEKVELTSISLNKKCNNMYRYQYIYLLAGTQRKLYVFREDDVRSEKIYRL